MADQSLANDVSLRERFLNWMRGNNQALVPTVERQGQLDTRDAIQSVVDINRGRPPVVLPQPQAPQGYSVQDIMRQIQSSRPQYDAAGNRIK